MKRRTAIVSGERVEVSWSETEDAVEAIVDGRAYKMQKRRVGPGELWLNVGGLSVEVAVTPTDVGYDVSVNGRPIPVEFVDSVRKGRRQGAATDGVATVRAPMPGKIVRVLLEPGAEVAIHQGIVVMEAMKMQNEIRSPRQGKIVRLDVGEGDAVKLGDLIAEIG